MRSATVVLCSLSLLGQACRASVSANAQLNAQGSADGETGTPGESGPTLAAAPAPTGSDTPLLGARHDLSLVPDKATQSCNCLDVGLGPANAASFRWQGGAPAVDPETQLVVALSTTSAHCTGAQKHPSGASYWGYRIVGNDVVVFVEAAHRGRPRTAGAIIPKPAGDGLVLVAPASKKLPFGRPVDGKGTRCKLGNPGPARTTPLSADELETESDTVQGPAPEPAGSANSVD